MALVDVEGFSTSANIADYVTGGLLTNIDTTSIQAGGAFGDNYLLGQAGSGNGGAARTLPGLYGALVCGFRFATSSSFGDQLHEIMLSNADAQKHLSLIVNQLTGRLQVRRGYEFFSNTPGVLLGSSAPGACPTGFAWAYIEIGAVIDPANGSVEVRVNGETVLSATGVNTAGAPAGPTVARVEWRNRALGGAPAFRVQHFYVTDRTGPAPNNTFLGDVRVQRLQPSGPGGATQFTPTGAPTNWQAAATAPPAPATIYNTANTAGALDLFTLQPMDPYSDQVFGVAAKVLAAKTTAGTRTVRTELKSGAAFAHGATRFLGTTPTYLRDIQSLDPATGAPWTPAGVNALQLGYGIVA